MGLDDREYFNPKSGKTFINTDIRPIDPVASF